MKKQLGWYDPESLHVCSEDIKKRKPEIYAPYSVPVFADDTEQALAQRENKLKLVKEQFSKDVCSEHRFHCSDSICRNRPPETTNLMNACLSCSLRETCKLLFCK